MDCCQKYIVAPKIVEQPLAELLAVLGGLLWLWHLFVEHVGFLVGFLLSFFSFRFLVYRVNASASTVCGGMLVNKKNQPDKPTGQGATRTLKRIDRIASLVIPLALLAMIVVVTVKAFLDDSEEFSGFFWFAISAIPALLSCIAVELKRYANKRDDQDD